MASDFRIAVDWLDHHKTEALRQIHRDGPECLLRLWAFAAQRRQDGYLTDLTPPKIELIARWPGPGGAFWTALQGIGWVDDLDGIPYLHDWHEHQPWIVGERARSLAASEANRIRWEKERAKKANKHPGRIRTGSGSAPPFPSLPLPSPPLPSEDKDISPATRAHADMPGLIACWAAYPHHGTRSRKEKARAVWAKRGLEAQTAAVLRWIAYAKESADWKRERGRFVPGMQVWLGGVDFTEEPPPVAFAPGGDADRMAALRRIAEES